MGMNSWIFDLDILPLVSSPTNTLKSENENSERHRILHLSNHVLLLNLPFHKYCTMICSFRPKNNNDNLDGTPTNPLTQAIPPPSLPPFLLSSFLSPLPLLQSPPHPPTPPQQSSPAIRYQSHIPPIHPPSTPNPLHSPLSQNILLALFERAVWFIHQRTNSNTPT